MRPHPSVVWYQPNRSPIVGTEAKRNIFGFAEAPGNVFISSIKKSLGHDTAFSIFGKMHSVDEIAAEIFQHLKQDAEVHHNADLSEAVVTIPVEFDGRSRRELRRAADRAGIHIKAFVHEPFAAAVAHFYSQKSGRTLSDREGETVLVFDWGGGTLDITVARIMRGVVSELAAVGIPDRSGDHFDEVLGNSVKTTFLNSNRIPADELLLRPGVRDRLRAECESAKIVTAQ